MCFGTVQKIIGESIRNGAFTSCSAPCGRGIAASSWPEDLPPPADAAAFFTPGKSIPAKRSAKVEALLRDGYFFKRYRRRGLGETFKNFFRVSRPDKVLAAAWKLRSAGLRIPEVLLAGETGPRFRRERILLTRALPDGAAPWDKLSLTLLDADALRAFAETAAETLVKMHAAGVAHGDLNLRNLYNDGGILWIIDWDGAVFYRTPRGVPYAVRQKELARLISSIFRNWRCRGHETSAAERRKITAEFVRQYTLKSGIDLAGQRLDQRIIYLTERVRKDGHDAIPRPAETQLK